MQIKSNKQPSLFKNAIVLLGLLAVLLSIGFLTKEKAPEKLNPNIPAPAKSGFLTQNSTLLQVLEHYQDHLIFFSVKDEAAFKFPQELRDVLAEMGGDSLAQLALRNSYAAVFQNGKFLKEAISGDGPVLIKHGETTVESAGNGHGNFSKLSLNTVRHTADNRGLNLFIVNKVNQLVGTWCFDFFETATPTSSAMNWMGGDLEKIVLTVKGKHYKKLKKKRDDAIIAQVLLNADGDEVPADLHFKEQDYDIQMRLKGDWVDHLQGEQWSFRVKVENDQTLMGMRKFSLHRPGTRNYAGEWLFHQVLAKEGVLNLQYHFVQVELRIEDEMSSEIKNLGIYALEEGFDKQLIERNQRREGVIIKLDESLMWEEHEAYLNGQLEIPDIQYLNFHKYKEMNIVPFAEKRIREDSTLYKQFLTGSALFRDYIDGKKKLSEVFDVELTAKYTAIANLLGGNHALGGHNYRVYYNPVTSKLEPIGFDGNAGKKVFGFMEFYNSRNDFAFQEAYTRAVEKYTEDEYIQQLINWPGLPKMIALMQTVYHKYQWTGKMLIHNQRTLQGSIRPKRPLRINFNGIEKGFFSVNIENFSRMPMEVLELSYRGKKVFGRPVKKTILPAKSRTAVQFKLDIDYEKVFTKKGKQKVGFNSQADIDKIKIAYKTIGSKFIQYDGVLLWSSDRNNVVKKDPFQRGANADQFDFLIFDEENKTITCEPGQWQLESPLVIPAGYTFVAGPGVRFDIMSQYTSIFSYSPLKFVGTPDNPVEIFSNTNMGKGLLVMNTSDTSLLRYCRFNNLSNPASIGWSVTGAVNFYEADVKLEHCSFSNNRCEDALNILRSHFEMSDCVFSNVHADAFDGDFVTGTVKDCIFTNIGNDAIDVSGSTINVEHVAIDQAGDKGISAGEDSKINAFRILVKNSEIALASKDQSVLTIKKAFLENNKLGFTAFQKKPEFGPAEIIADSIDLNNNKLIHLIEINSMLQLNGKNMETVRDVIDKMYGEEFGKSSK
ncbi:MAG: hypothetical protein AAFZ15_27145 [Bacteroidota bacterium]